MTLNEIGLAAFDLARSKGFHAEPRENVLYHGRPERIAARLALIHSEVSEALECVARGRAHQGTGEHGAPVGVAYELADVIIRVCDLAHSLGLDLDQAVATKHAYNTTRTVRHGGKLL